MQVMRTCARVPLRTYKRFEKDGKGTLETFIQILRALGRAQYLMYLFPQPLPAQLPVTIEAKHRQLRNRVQFDKACDSTERSSNLVSQPRASKGNK